MWELSPKAELKGYLRKLAGNYGKSISCWKKEFCSNYANIQSNGIKCKFTVCVFKQTREFAEINSDGQKCLSKSIIL